MPLVVERVQRPYCRTLWFPDHHRMAVDQGQAKTRATSSLGNRHMPTRWPVTDHDLAVSSSEVHGDDVFTLAERWQQAAEDRHPAPWPFAEAHDVVAAVLGVGLGASSEEMLHEVGQRWGAIHRDTETLAERVEILRQIVVDEWSGDHDALHGVLDAVVASAAMALSRRLEADARTDALTGVGNRRAFDESLEAALKSAARHHYAVSLVIVDVDGMKQINDCRGHQAGDDTLVKFAHALESSLRRGDHVFRIGGDEFAIVMPYCPRHRCRGLMRRVQTWDVPPFSWGVAAFPEDGAFSDSLLAVADAAMYRRKRHMGRVPRLGV